MRVGPDTQKSARFADNLVSTLDDKWWIIEEALGNDSFLCRPLKTATMSTKKLGVDLPWEKVGVRRYAKKAIIQSLTGN